ncbi:MAG: GDSL-type esterase/lipase family protein [Bacteroides sp.]|nr:GDSL-type esterase/lipase family protein [Bacteroides sp.]MCM1458133.1 GDSL-type esterase/lipase family protein [Lachnoclostridium sp.]
MKRIAFAVTALLSLLSASAQEAYKPDVFYYQRSTLFDVLPVNPSDIIMLGNSLTNGGEWHELLGMPNVKNRGISSDVIDGVKMRLRPLVKGQPAKIFLMIGVNDISHDLTADSVASAYLDLIREIRRDMPGTKLYVQSCLPVNISFGRYKKMADKEQVIRNVNALVAAQAEKEGFTWIDLYSRFADSDGHMHRHLTNDGLHLLGPGYLLWRDTIRPYVVE